MTRKKKEGLLSAVRVHIMDCKIAVAKRQKSPELAAIDLTHYAQGLTTVLMILGIDHHAIASEFEQGLAELIDSNGIRRVAGNLYSMIQYKAKGHIFILPEPERRLVVALHAVLNPPNFVKPN